MLSCKSKVFTSDHGKLLPCFVVGARLQSTQLQSKVKFMRSLYSLSSFFLLSTCIGAHALPITYTYSANLSGSLGGTSFTQAVVVFTQMGNTSGISLLPTNVYVNDSGTTTVMIQGIGTATVLSSTFGAYAQQQGQLDSLGFFDTTTNFGVAELGGPVGYDLSTSIISSGSKGASGSSGSEATSLGALLITQPAGGIASFTAVAATPEPSGLVLLGTGVLGVAGVLRRRLRTWTTKS